MFTATDWTAVASASAAGGTLVLALFTWRLARSSTEAAGETRELARETRRIADLAERELGTVTEQVRSTRDEVEESLRAERKASQPLLVPVSQREIVTGLPTSNGHVAEDLISIGSAPMCWRDSRDDTFWVVVPVRNAGSAAAVIDSPTDVELHDLTGTVAFGSMSTPIIAPGDCDNVVFRSVRNAFCDLEKLPAQSPRPKVLEMTVRYREISGTLRTLSRFSIAKADNDEMLEVIGVDIEYEPEPA